MKRVHLWLASLAIATLFTPYMTAACASTGDTVQATGGGWILPQIVAEQPTVTRTSTQLEPTAGNNVKANFAFVAAGTVQADGSLGDCQGELSYHDHGVGLRLHSISVTELAVVDAHTMRFRGTADVSTSAGSVPSDFIVTVHDTGEPGTSADWLEIRLPNFTLYGETSPYHRKGSLGGGSIQVSH